jgi:hypothetical protein
MRALVVTVTMCLLILPAQAKYSGGNGTAASRYRIATAGDLLSLGDSPQDYGKYFVLVADIDLDPSLPGRKVFQRTVIAPNTDQGDRYLTFSGTPFTGSFEGAGHVISHLTITGGGYLGLFGQLGRAGEVRR